MNPPLNELENLPKDSAIAVRTPTEAAETALAGPSGFRRVMSLFPGGMFIRYLLIGAGNTLAGYGSFVVVLHFLGNVIPARYLYLAAPLASVLSTPVNITIAYFGYKFFVFKTRGNYLLEWLKCFAVYGAGMIPGLFALGALTRLFQSMIHTHAPMLHATLGAIESHLSGAMLHTVQQAAASKSIAGNLAGAIVMGFTTICSFIGHRKVTFNPVA